MLACKNISVTFNEGSALEKKALCQVSCTIEDGQFVTILGGNGAGKSTFFNVIGGQLASQKGQVLLAGQDITKWPDYRRSRIIGRLFQNPSLGTAAKLSVEENLALAYGRDHTRWYQKALRKSNREVFIQALKNMDLNLEDRLKTPMGLLSGGQRQAVALLMSLLNDPKLLLLDEHTAALDPISAQKVMDITEKWVKEKKMTTLMITHNVKDALAYGNRLLIFKEGRIAYDFDESQKQALTLNDVMACYDV